MAPSCAAMILRRSGGIRAMLLRSEEREDFPLWRSYFIDAAATPAVKGQPVGGLTIIAFYNHHMEYALTWFAMAVLSLVGIIVVRRATR